MQAVLTGTDPPAFAPRRAGRGVRHGLACALAAACMCAGAAVGAAAPAGGPPVAPIKAPHYGDTLFHFYQEHWFTAVTSLMVAQHFGRVAPHGDEAEVLRGGLLLSWGLHREAGEVFAQLIERGAAPPVRDRAWFYLAKIRYQRGLLAPAEEALSRITGELPPELQDERLLLGAQLLLARSDFAAAAAVLEGLKGRAAATPVARFYARYNLGVALVRSGDTARGSALLNELGQLPASDEEQRSLRDRANVALGFAALQAKQPQIARHALQRVRLTGLHANKALLGFGWAAAEMQEPHKALLSWDELARREPFDAAVLEARIALPYALAEIGAHDQALARYEEAVQLFEREHGALAESMATIRTGTFTQGLLEQNPSQGMGWFAGIRQLPQAPQMPHASHLAQVLAGHEFQEAFKNFRDLRFLSGNLQDWQASLGVFSAMLDNRRQGYAQRLPQVLAHAGELHIGALQQRRETLAAELSRAEIDTDTAALADARQREWRQRIERAQATLRGAGNAAELADAPERLRRVAGALTWQLAQQYPARLWEAKKALRSTDALFADTSARDAALAQAQQQEPARHEDFAARIAQLSQRLQALSPQVAALEQEQQAQLQDLAVAELVRQQERLDVYSAQARLAIAQLLDRAQIAQRARHEAPP